MKIYLKKIDYSSGNCSIKKTNNSGAISSVLVRARMGEGSDTPRIPLESLLWQSNREQGGLRLL